MVVFATDRVVAERPELDTMLCSVGNLLPHGLCRVAVDKDGRIVHFFSEEGNTIVVLFWRHVYSRGTSYNASVLVFVHRHSWLREVCVPPDGANDGDVGCSQRSDRTAQGEVKHALGEAVKFNRKSLREPQKDIAEVCVWVWVGGWVGGVECVTPFSRVLGT